MAPKSKPVGSGRTFSVEKIWAVFSGECQTLGELAHQLDNLSNVIVILAIPGARCRVKEIVSACQ